MRQTHLLHCIMIKDYHIIISQSIFGIKMRIMITITVITWLQRVNSESELIENISGMLLFWRLLLILTRIQIWFLRCWMLTIFSCFHVYMMFTKLANNTNMLMTSVEKLCRWEKPQFTLKYSSTTEEREKDGWKKCKWCVSDHRKCI